MIQRTVTARPEHEVVYQDIIALVGKHAHKVTQAELLAIAANMVGKMIAMQDQRTMSRETALKILIANLELGNQQVINELKDAIGGHA